VKASEVEETIDAINLEIASLLRMKSKPSMADDEDAISFTLKKSMSVSPKKRALKKREKELSSYDSSFSDCSDYEYSPLKRRNTDVSNLTS
jgi:hypothetical protein